LDACRQIKSMGGDTRNLVGMFWPCRSTPSLTCTVEVGAGLMVDEGKTRFRKYQARPEGLNLPAETDERSLTAPIRRPYDTEVDDNDPIAHRYPPKSS
jgi:hypothetical protein